MATDTPTSTEKMDSGIGTPESHEGDRKTIVVVGLGMVGIAFIEKMLKLDAKRQEYRIIVIGEETHFAYNRVGLTSFFQHRKEENLYLNDAAWYETAARSGLSYHLNTIVTEIHTGNQTVLTSTGESVHYDILVLATGSNAILPRHTPGYDARGVFVYRTIDDLQQLIKFADTVKGTNGAVVGGGLLGLEAAKAMMDLETFGNVSLIERNKWVLSRQLDSDAGGLVVELVRKLGLDVKLSKRVGTIQVDENNAVKGVIFEDGEQMDCTSVMFAIGVKARDELARQADLKCSDRGGGVVVGNDLQTSHPGIYAIGECASWENETYGLIAPGIEMADVLAFNLTQAKDHSPRSFKRPDLSTKLKLLGVEVASFGDYFADRDGPKHLPGRAAAASRRAASKEKHEGKKKLTTSGSSEPEVKALTYKDPFNAVYKKYIFTPDGKYLLGGMMIGDTSDYIRLVPMVKEQKALDIPPSQFIIGAKKEGDDGADDLPDETQICSCHNVSKGDIIEVVKEGTCKSIGEVKACTKAGTGCGGCMPLVQTIFNKQMMAMGAEITNHLCAHFKFSRADLYNIVAVKKLDSFKSVMKEAGTDPDSYGCEACKPAVASILASLYNKHIMAKPLNGLQDTNDKFLANIQRNGSFSVVPRVAGGEIKPEHLIALGSVAKKFNLYTKITGGQRVDLFGAKKYDLPKIWKELIDAGMESGHAYAKSLRTVKSCVGTTWCRFGIGDSVGMAVRLEERYKSIRSPHKIKGGVSGCVRECAEAQNKDFGLIATEKGFNIFVGGNGGAKPRHSEVLAKDVPPDDVVPILDRYLMFYIRTADKLQRTARWLENLPGGIDYLRDVVLKDKLGIAAELETQMAALIGTFFCEWKAVLDDPKLMSQFTQFANTEDRLATMEEIQDRGQTRPAYWARDAVTENFRNTQWSSLSWQPVLESSYFVNAADTPSGMSATIKRGDTQLALFWVRGQLYCTQQMCPHKRAFVLSDGLIGDEVLSGDANDKESLKKRKLWVSCPNHKRNFQLNDVDVGEKGAVGNESKTSSNNNGAAGAGSCLNDDSLSIATFAVEERADGWIYVKLPPVDELDARLGTSRWLVRANETNDPFAALDRKLAAEKSLLEKGRKGKKPQQMADAPVPVLAASREVAVGGAGGCSTGMDW